MKGPNNFRKGKFVPDNPHKYMGDVNNIIYRSSWELSAFEFCDDNKHVICWASEEIPIMYPKPCMKTGKVRMSKYYPDLYVEYCNKNGELVKDLIEIKPDKQRRRSKARNPVTKKIENMTWLINQAKWKAAEDWCNTKGIRFKVMTENHIFR